MTMNAVDTDNIKSKKKEYDRQRYQQKREQLLATSKEYHRKNPESGREAQRRYRERFGKIQKKDLRLQRKYKISWEQFVEIYNLQQGKCKICDSFIALMDEGQWNKTANVDHCHVSGRVRGLLCSSCNRGIGFLQDNSDLLRKAAEYLDAN